MLDLARSPRFHIAEMAARGGRVQEPQAGRHDPGTQIGTDGLGKRDVHPRTVGGGQVGGVALCRTPSRGVERPRRIWRIRFGSPSAFLPNAVGLRPERPRNASTRDLKCSSSVSLPERRKALREAVKQ